MYKVMDLVNVDDYDDERYCLLFLCEEEEMLPLVEWNGWSC